MLMYILFPVRLYVVSLLEYRIYNIINKLGLMVLFNQMLKRGYFNKRAGWRLQATEQQDKDIFLVVKSVSFLFFFFLTVKKTSSKQLVYAS